MEARISILERSTPQVDINAPICPFCGEPQDTRRGITAGTMSKLFKLCGCDGMKAYLEDRTAIIDCKDRIRELDKRFERDRNTAWARLKSRGIGSRFLEATFESFDRDLMSKAYETALSYAQSFDKNDGRGLIFTGNAGTGKTHLAAAIAGKIIDEYSLFVEFVSFVELLADIKAAFSERSGKDVMLEKRMKEAALLIIDDLGREKRSQFTDELLYRVVDFRYRNKLPLIITTNYDLKSLSERIDYAVLSRIIGICRAVDMNGMDYRVKDYLS